MHRWGVRLPTGTRRPCWQTGQSRGQGDRLATVALVDGDVRSATTAQLLAWAKACAFSTSRWRAVSAARRSIDQASSSGASGPTIIIQGARRSISWKAEIEVAMTGRPEVKAQVTAAEAAMPESGPVGG